MVDTIVAAAGVIAVATVAVITAAAGAIAADITAAGVAPTCTADTRGLITAVTTIKSDLARHV